MNTIVTHCPSCEVESRGPTAADGCWSCDRPTLPGPIPLHTVNGVHSSRRLFAGATLDELIGEPAA